jgi:hypothetical protein
MINDSHLVDEHPMDKASSTPLSRLSVADREMKHFQK